MTNSANDFVLGKHLESLASAAKNYTLLQISLQGGVSYDSGSSSDFAEFETALDSAFNPSIASAQDFDSALDSAFNPSIASAQDFDSALDSAFNPSIASAQDFDSALDNIFN
ncbi:MAG: hypothetical protein IJK81_13680 [Selenomonadaceae bacterium]|nr:hypothetical protein [Selenomonadaceae bacterium]